MNAVRLFLAGMVGGLLSGGGPLAVRAEEGVLEKAIGSLSLSMLGHEEGTPPEGAPEETFSSHLTFKGYLETSYTLNHQKPKPAAGNENVGRIFDVNSNEFMLNAVELVIERPVDDNHLVGFVINPLLGQTAPFTASAGLFAGENIDLVQAFIQVYVPSTRGKVVMGKFVTSAGAEVIYSPANANFSRSFLFGLAIPFTHTGITYSQPLLSRADTKDLLIATVGLVNGWDLVKDNNESKSILTSATLTPVDAFALTANFFYSFSEQAAGTAGAKSSKNGRTLFDLVAIITPEIEGLEGLKLLLNLDWGGEEGASTTGGYAVWWGFAGIVHYDLPVATEGARKEWYVAARGEYFHDGDGSRTGGFAGGVNDLTLYEMTLTLGYTPWHFLLLRTELRYDKADGDVFFHGSNAPAGTPNRNNQTTLAFDAIFNF